MRDLVQYQPDMIFAVPLGMKAWLEAVGAVNVIEMDWSESILLSDMTDQNRPQIRVQCKRVCAT